MFYYFIFLWSALHYLLYRLWGMSWVNCCCLWISNCSSSVCWRHSFPWLTYLCTVERKQLLGWALWRGVFLPFFLTSWMVMLSAVLALQLWLLGFCCSLLLMHWEGNQWWSLTWSLPPRETRIDLLAPAINLHLGIGPVYGISTLFSLSFCLIHK